VVVARPSGSSASVEDFRAWLRRFLVNEAEAEHASVTPEDRTNGDRENVTFGGEKRA
jgi:hypothetical protein